MLRGPGRYERAAGGTRPAASKQVLRTLSKSSHRLGQGLHLLQALLVGLLVLLVRLDHYHTGGPLGACGCTQVLQRRKKGSLGKRPYSLYVRKSQTVDPPSLTWFTDMRYLVNIFKNILNWLPLFKLSKLSSGPATLGLYSYMVVVKRFQPSRGCPLWQGLCSPGSCHPNSLCPRPGSCYAKVKTVTVP